MDRPSPAKQTVARIARRPAYVVLALCVATSAARDAAAQSADTAAQGTAPIADWNFNNGNQGWAAQNQSQVSAEDGRLHVTSTGNDPFIGVPVKGPAGWKTLTLRVRTPQNLNSQLFWTTTAEPGTSESKSVRFRLRSRGSRFRETVIYFHTAAPLRSLRLDPHSQPIALDIARITLQTSGPPPAEPATDPAAFKTPPGFRVELLYSVPKTQHGSWVSMTVDTRGRLITCDQYGGLYRVTPPAAGSDAGIQIESIAADIGEAQGLLYAFDSLYIMVNRGGKYASGLYRLRDTNQDDRFDKLEVLKLLQGGGEHGPHAIVPAPDGQSLYVVAGNNTRLPDDVVRHRLPANWGEDQLLPRQPCSNGHNTGVLAPGGWVCRIGPDGQNWELVAAGFRNPYDLAFHRHGELFTFDADMEMDVGTPWYRPTRVCHVVSGAEFGWRFGTGKWPDYALDSLPAVAEIGQGSPTGVAFGYGARFPHKYQEALYVCDWTYGRMYAVHLEPAGASYRGTLEEFLTGTPLPLTDMVVNPVDGALYFTIGGRRTQSGLYRITYTGPETPVVKTEDAQAAALRKLRRRLEALHDNRLDVDVNLGWEYLGHADRHVRYSARVAVEHRPVATWTARALTETDVQRSVPALLALARSTPAAPAGQASAIGPRIIAALIKTADRQLDDQLLLDWTRVLAVTLARHGYPADDARDRILEHLQARFPAGDVNLNRELCRILVALNSPRVVPRAISLMNQSRVQEDLLYYGMALRVANNGWNGDLQTAYYRNLNRAEEAAATGDFVGGGHFQIYVQRMREDAAKQLNSAQRKQLAGVLKAPIASAVPTGSPTPGKFVRNWKIADLLPELDQMSRGRSFAVGQQMYVRANCAGCHRFGRTGGILGPDLTAAGKRYSRPVLLREILDPSQQISDQFRTHVIVTTAGRVYEGRILDRNENTLTVAIDPRKPASVVQIPADQVETLEPSKVSMMPADLLNTLSKQEILDLMAYVQSGGDPKHPNFRE
jgi:putative heme-binding domain-containing protein